MPTFDELEFVELLKRYVEVEQEWVPRGEGHSMYLRPTCVATDPFLGVGVPQEATLYVIASPVGPYFPDGFKPITVVADTVNVRAWPGGAGPVASELWRRLSDAHYGRDASGWAVAI